MEHEKYSKFKGKIKNQGNMKTIQESREHEMYSRIKRT
jgi:hypothetical protein